MNVFDKIRMDFVKEYIYFVMNHENEEAMDRFLKRIRGYFAGLRCILNEIIVDDFANEFEFESWMDESIEFWPKVRIELVDSDVEIDFVEWDPYYDGEDFNAFVSYYRKRGYDTARPFELVPANR